jgi:hypothetical protein
MGRQTAIAMDLEDERAFLAFLRSTADLAIFRSWSPEPREIAEFSLESEADPFYLHNKAFSWEPEFELVNVVRRDTGDPVSYYRLRDRLAPLLEYSRHPLQASDPTVGGRLYWAKDFPGNVSYDVEEFGEWYSAVTRWVRRNGVKVRHGQTEPWCLPGARGILSNER